MLVIRYGTKNLKATYFLEDKTDQFKETGNSRMKRDLGIMVTRHEVEGAGKPFS